MTADPNHTVTAPDLTDVLACPTCDGLGELHVEEPCDYCDGTGDAPNDDMCSHCDGSGHHVDVDTCGSCDGRGQRRPHPNYGPFMDRVISAFSSLASAGWAVDAGEHCCQTCAHGARESGDHRPFIGFDIQEADELATDGDELWVFHLMFSPADAAVARSHLIAAGLTVEWDNGAHTKIRLTVPSEDT